MTPCLTTHVHAYAVKDRVDYSAFASSREPGMEQNLYSILPNDDDYESLKKRFVIYVTRIIVEHIKFFQPDFHHLAQRHIPHQFSEEMSIQSEVVSRM